MTLQHFRWNYRAIILKFLMFDCKLCKTPLKWLFCSIDNLGVQFWYNGDEVIWLWPWKRRGYKYISILASGTGEFGDATYNSLKEIDNFWAEYEEATTKAFLGESTNG